MTTATAEQLAAMVAAFVTGEGLNDLARNELADVLEESGHSLASGMVRMDMVARSIRRSHWETGAAVAYRVVISTQDAAVEAVRRSYGHERIVSNFLNGSITCEIRPAD